ncbi:MAG TPA: hypothetical protein VFP96_09650 [Candidatus Acidoferrum sp.]|nr:hypothetical protein [Candidatus Acidoferrum sp.]
MTAHIARAALVLIVVLFTSALLSAQTQTDTNCTTSPDYGAGRTTNCTSTTTAAPPSGGWLTGVNKALAANRAKAEANKDQKAQQGGQLSPEAMKELLAEEKREREAKDTVDYIYCRQNANGTLTDFEGKPRTCAEVIAYTKAFCLVNPTVERCTLAKSKAEVEKAFSALSEDYKNDPRRNKRDVQMYFDSLFTKLIKWGCMSFPDMTLPQRDGTLHICPDAPDTTAQKQP